MRSALGVAEVTCLVTELRPVRVSGVGLEFELGGGAESRLLDTEGTLESSTGPCACTYIHQKSVHLTYLQHFLHLHAHVYM